jgi:DNA invertase Pin-like site-specific DNA recombinase
MAARRTTTQQTFDLYVRVSRVNGRDGDSFISPEVQEDRCRALAAAKGYKVGRVHRDLDQSGGKMDRPGLQAALDRVEAGASAGIIVATLDRFARTLTGALATLAEIEEAGGQVIACDGEFDTTTANGRLVRDFMLRLHQHYREVAAEKWEEAKINAKARGIYISARTPFGYRKAGGRLLQHEQEAAWVAEVFKRRATGEQWDTICEWLNLQGARTPIVGDGTGKTGGGNPWLEGALRKLVQNPLYKGEPKGHDGLPSDVLDGLRIVSPRRWAAAQPRDGGRRPRTPDGALLGGLVHCGVCGGLMTAEVQTKPSGNRFQAYRCRQRAANRVGTCPKPMTISGNLLEPYVTRLALLAIKDAELPVAVGRPNEELEPLREALADAKYDLEKFEHAALAEGLKPAAVAGLLAQYTARVKEAQTAVDAATEPVGMRPTERHEVLERWDVLGTADRRAMLKEALQIVTVQPGKEPIADRTKLVWREPFKAPLLDANGGPMAVRS